jgi:hypothetical protein
VEYLSIVCAEAALSLESGDSCARWTLAVFYCEFRLYDEGFKG